MNSAEFAAALKRYRARHGWTQAQAAAHLGVPLRTWQNWEIARNRPPEYALATLTALMASPLEFAADPTPKPAARRRESTQTPAGKKRPRPSRSAKPRSVPAEIPPEESHLATHLL
jgi:transcriptional regulator with XRE-family HTH domain